MGMPFVRASEDSVEAWQDLRNAAVGQEWGLSCGTMQEDAEHIRYSSGTETVYHFQVSEECSVVLDLIT